MRNWLKRLILECLKSERISAACLILANRPPSEADYNYLKGTVWVEKNKRWYLEEINAKWVMLDERQERFKESGKAGTVV